jgi:translation initiation factor 3 subunit F
MQEQANKYSNNHIQDVLVISYLANTIRTQIDLSNRLATATLTAGVPDISTADGEKRGDGQRGGRGGRGRGRGEREPRES